MKLVLENTKKDIELIINILEDYDLYDEKKKVKLSSAFLLKNKLECENVDPNSNIRIGKLKLNDYNINNYINNNIRNINSR